ncbi:MAG: hypothetical protein R3B13_01645 [Polyangiaceae bacterium]
MASPLSGTLSGVAWSRTRPRRALATALVFTAWVCLAPRAWFGCQAARWYEGKPTARAPLAERVRAAVEERDDALFYHSGQARFDGQSAVAIYQMTLLGLGQLIEEQPELRERYLPAMRLAAHRLVDPKTLDYARRVYGAHGVVAMAPGAGHAYLGYINLGLGMLRKHDPSTDLAALHDRLTARLATRLFASPTGMIETYPGETWPPDVAAVAGSIGLHAEATGSDASEKLRTWATRFETCAVTQQKGSGYLAQRLVTGSCRAKDAPRGSGTAVAAYFISFAAPALSSKLYQSVQQQSATFLGFGGVREYAPGFSGKGDTNAGPILFGISVGATGFAIGAARAHGDRNGFTTLARTALLFGAPTATADGERFAVGGALGDALLLAMLTARRR